MTSARKGRAIANRIRSVVAILVSILVGFAGTPVRAGRRPSKKLIEFGWDQPDTAFLRRHFREMDRSPFDGVAFVLRSRDGDGRVGNFSWEAWGSRGFDRSDLRDATTDLRAISFRHLKHNFIRFNVTPGNINWFGDFSAVLQNARLAAAIAREARCDGILFDVESYRNATFSFHAQPDAGRVGWDAYARQVQGRGAQLMQAFQAGFPGIRILLTYGFELPWVQSHEGALAPSDGAYGLLAPFLNGMLEEISGNSRIIDGYEYAYKLRSGSQFLQARSEIRQGVLPLVDQSSIYAHRFSVGFGIWLDAEWSKRGWNVIDPSVNDFNPSAFRDAVTQALTASDEYVWIYSQKAKWWSEPDGKPRDLPQDYLTALDEAKRRANR